MLATSDDFTGDSGQEFVLQPALSTHADYLQNAAKEIVIGRQRSLHCKHVTIHNGAN
ncbi:MAG TPA: hypothetical protein VK051_00280 [Paenalcaligenes sp.]|nr:hypothetical protein [Paenalcaligenes sp.]